jgi:hypothetical protein
MKPWIATTLGVVAVTGLWAGHRAVTDNEPPAPPAVADTAPVPLPAPPRESASAPSPTAEASQTDVTTVASYEEMKRRAGFELHSEFANTGTPTLHAYLQQHLDGNLQEEEFIGAACWHLAVRAAANLGSVNNDHNSPRYKWVAYYTVLSATALRDSGPVRHVVQNYLGNVGREELGVALAHWAVANFDDDSTENLRRFIDTMYSSASRRGYPMDEDKITVVLSWLYSFQELLPEAPQSRMAGEEVPRA